MRKVLNYIRTLHPKVVAASIAALGATGLIGLAEGVGYKLNPAEAAGIVAICQYIAGYSTKDRGMSDNMEGNAP